MRVAVLGPEGTFSHQAVLELFDDAEPLFCRSIREVFDSDADVGVVPVENSLGGGVTETIDLLRDRDVTVTGEHLLGIRHCLVSQEAGLEDVERVRSHPQALSQCGDFLEDHGWELVDAPSTARAARELGEVEAAVASRLAAEVNDLNVLAESVQDRESTTRFLVIGGEQQGKGGKTAVILEPGVDRAGLLHSMLGCFAGHHINLSHIESRPTKEELGEYFFYLEAETDQGSEEFQRALQCLETYADVTVLGSFGRR